VVANSLTRAWDWLVLGPLLILFAAHTAQASVEFAYAREWRSYSESESRKTSIQPPSTIDLTKRLTLFAGRSRTAGTHPVWGIEQIYTTPNLSKVVFAKRGARPQSGLDLDGAWVRIGRGFALHLHYNGEPWGFYTETLAPDERSQFRKALRQAEAKSRDKRRRTALSPWRYETLVLGEARAEAARPGAASERPRDPSPAPAQPNQGGDISAARLAVQCLGEAGDSGAAAVREAASGLWNTLWTGLTNPRELWEQAKRKYEETVQFIGNFQSEVSRAVSEFSALPAQEKVRVMCRLLGEAVATAAIGGGAAAAMAKLADRARALVAAARRAHTERRDAATLRREIREMERLEAADPNSHNQRVADRFSPPEIDSAQARLAESGVRFQREGADRIRILPDPNTELGREAQVAERNGRPLFVSRELVDSAIPPRHHESGLVERADGVSLEPRPGVVPYIAVVPNRRNGAELNVVRHENSHASADTLAGERAARGDADPRTAYVQRISGPVRRPDESPALGPYDPIRRLDETEAHIASARTLTAQRRPEEAAFYWQRARTMLVAEDNERSRAFANRHSGTIQSDGSGGQYYAIPFEGHGNVPRVLHIRLPLNRGPSREELVDRFFRDWAMDIETNMTFLDRHQPSASR
jgi:hypothetical protein